MVTTLPSTYQSTRASAQSAYEKQMARVKATQDFITKSRSLTKTDAIKIVSGQMPRITDTVNVYTNKKTGVTTTTMPSNIQTFLAERGYANTLIEDIPSTVFQPTKQNELRVTLSASTTDTQTQTATETQTAPDPRIYTEPKKESGILTTLNNNIIYIALGFGAILLISSLKHKSKEVALISV